MLLEDKNAVVYGGGGAVGGAVARAFAREGANVFLAGRTVAKVEAVAEEITIAGGTAETAQVDALDEKAVEKHIGNVSETAGRIDILFNAIGMQDVQGRPLHEMSFEDFSRPITIATRTQFLTARAVARHMIRQSSGVILTITAGPAHRALAQRRRLRHSLRGDRRSVANVCGRARAVWHPARCCRFGRIAGYTGCPGDAQASC